MAKTAQTVVKANSAITASSSQKAASSSQKAAAKKTTVVKEKTIKYTDKSAGQPELTAIFNTIKAGMKPYAKGAIKERGEKEGIYNLVSETQIETAGKKQDEIYFASLIVQKGYVGFYYMPVYTMEGIKQQLGQELLKCLKGKSCFHIKKNDPVIIGEINEALETGYKAYSKMGWV